MKSKTSCFNTTILKKNISHYWPVWVLFLCYLLLVLPGDIWLDATNKYSYEMVSETGRQYQIIGSAIRVAMEPAPIFLFAAVAAMMVFSYLYTAKNANMIHALPVNRFELFVTNYVSGILFLLIPEIVAFVTAVIVCLANQLTYIEYLFWWLLCAVGVTFFAYSMAVFIAMFTGLIFAMPLYFMIVNYLYVGCLYLIHLVKSLLCYGLLENEWNPGKSCILSPLYYLNNNLRARVIYDNTNTASGVRIDGCQLVLIYVAVAVVFIVVAYQLYKRRQIEYAGDFVSIGIVRPIFRWGVAFCGGTCLAVCATAMLKDARGIVNCFPLMLVCTLIFGGICFWLAEMLLQKNFKVFRRKRMGEWAVVALASVAFLLLFELDLFGVERRLPKAEEVEAAFVYMDYPLQVEEEDISELIALHRQVISHKKEYQQNVKDKDGKYYYTTFRYYLKDGSMLERRYELPVTETYLSDPSSPTATILAWEKQEERLKMQMFGMDYKNNKYYSGYIDLFSEDGDSKTYYFEEEQLTQILEALEKDVEEGNFNAYQMYSEQQEKEAFANGIGLNYYNRNNSYNMWDYFYRYREYMSETQEVGSAHEQVSADNSIYINFGEDCVNTVETLEKLGIVNEEWHLYTYKEQESLKAEK